ncbi:MAG: ABC transporter permease [Desulfobacteraceae bacterium]
MKSYKLTKIMAVAAGSLMQQKLRSFLSVLGVVCGVMAVIAMISIGQGAKEETLRQIEQLGTRNIYIKAVPQTHDQIITAREHLSQGITLSDLKRIVKGAKEIETAACLKEITTRLLAVDSKLAPQVVASSENFAELLGIPISSGRFIASQDRHLKNLVCVLGYDVANHLKDQGKIGKYLRMDGHLVKIIGILNRIEPIGGKHATISVRNYNEMIFLPLETAKTLDRKDSDKKSTIILEDQVSEIVVQVAHTKSVLRAAAMVKRILEVTHHHAVDYQMIVPLELLNQAERTQQTLNLVLGTIAAISLIVGGIGIMNIMLATVSERTREIGIRRAVGATRTDIMVQFLAEAVILTGAGGIIGLLGGMGTVVLFSEIAGWQMAISLWGVLLPLKLSLLVGIFFGLYPAKQAARVDPMVALRHE